MSEADDKPCTSPGAGHGCFRIRDDLGLPKEIWMIDTRAGAITDSQSKGAAVEVLRDAVGHTNTTQRSMRNRKTSDVDLVRLRERRGQNRLRTKFSNSEPLSS